MISDFDVGVRLAVAAALGCAVGFERERLLWAAGIRTHMLVSVGACLLMIVSAYGFQHAILMPHVVLDPSRVAAQVVSGIGFLGAGSILLRGDSVRGLTTAASIWAVAAIGLAAGGGLYFAASISTIIILVILAGVKPLEEAYRARMQSCWLEVQADTGAIATDRLPKTLGLRAGQVRRIVSRHGIEDDFERVLVHITRVSKSDIKRAEESLRRLPGVSSVGVIRGRRPSSDGSQMANETSAEREALR